METKEPLSIVENCDNMIGMARYPDGYFDLAIVDPPYGIFSGENAKGSTMGWLKKSGKGGGYASKYEGKAEQWDVAPTPEYFTELKRVSKHQIIWGANYFPYQFFNFCVWRKLTISESFSMAMAEIASVSLPGNGKVFQHAPQGTDRFHPTQKPVKLYKDLLRTYAKFGNKILDTHMGSQSSRIASHQMGYDYTGFELDPQYFNDGNDRFNKECKGVIKTKTGTNIQTGLL